MSDGLAFPKEGDRKRQKEIRHIQVEHDGTPHEETSLRMHYIVPEMEKHGKYFSQGRPPFKSQLYLFKDI